MQHPNKIKLFSYLRCPFAMRVRMVLHEKEIPFEVKEEDLRNFSEELRALHPEAKVPLLIHGEHVIYESAIITEYLDEAFSKNPLMPQEASARAEVRLWTYWCNQILKPAVDRFKYGTSRFSEKECEGAEDKLKAHFAKLEDRLKFGNWLVGDHFTLADIHVFPFVRQASKITPTPSFLTSYPSTIQWLEKILTRPAFQKTMLK